MQTCKSDVYADKEIGFFFLEMLGEIFFFLLLFGLNEIEPKCSGTMIIYLVFELSSRKGNS